MPSSAELIEAAARRLRVLGHPLRLQVLDLLAERPRNVTEIAAELGVHHQTASKHLSELHRCGVVARRQNGNLAVYSLPDALMIKAVALVCRGVVEERARLAQLASEAKNERDSR